MKLVILIASLAFVACSSKAKTEAETTATDTAKTTVAEAQTTATETVEKKKAEKKMAETTTSSDSSMLPSISGTEKSSVTCTNNTDTRKITVLNVTDGGCGVVYNKMGEDKTVALAKVDMNYCESVSTKIKSNLEGAGFSCDGQAASSSDTATH